MKGKLTIEFGAADGSAAGEKFKYDIVMDVLQHGFTVDQNGQIFFSLSGQLPRREPPRGGVSGTPS